MKYYDIYEKMGDDDRLTIEKLQDSYEDDYLMIWVNLIYGDEQRMCCYERKVGEHCWNYVDGDSEPEMSDTILKLWYGEEGDKALDCLYRI